MEYKNDHLKDLLPFMDLGSSIAELDQLLEIARVETSVFTDLLLDKVDLIPGTKGSGKSALYRIFVEFLPDLLLKQQKAVIAYGVSQHGDSVFHAFKDRFSKLSESDFVNFWCIYIVSLIHEQFIKHDRYNDHLKQCNNEIENFRRSCEKAYIPEIKSKRNFLEILEWALNALAKMAPKIKFIPPENVGEFEIDLFGNVEDPSRNSITKIEESFPQYIEALKSNLEEILIKSGLNIWIMIDRLDEIFPRRTDIERKALRGLLRTMRIFSSPNIRLKIFLRDDMLNEVVIGGEGFTALTHITARQADTLRWSEEQILTMIVKRLFAGNTLKTFLSIDSNHIDASQSYREAAFYKVFPDQVYQGEKQSSTIRWIYNHTADGNGVVTPRDVIDLLSKAKQHQTDMVLSNLSGSSQAIIEPSSILYGSEQLSIRKRQTYLEAEFPHLWPYMEKFIGGKAQYNSRELKKLLGNDWENIVKDLVCIGFISNGMRKESIYKIPFIYRKGLELTQR